MHTVDAYRLKVCLPNGRIVWLEYLIAARSSAHAAACIGKRATVLTVEYAPIKQK